MKRPLRIYLDQKDFGRIADALCRGDESCPDIVAYERLRHLVSAGHARVYFSFVHVVEALRFRDVRSPLAAAYCDVVDTLTEGHCIRFVSHLQRAELALALGDLFGFQPEYRRDSYAYGRYAEGVTIDGLRLDYESIPGVAGDSAFRELEQLRAELRGSLPNRHSIRAFLRRVPPAASTQADALLPPGMNRTEFLRIVITGSEEQRRKLASSVIGNPGFIQRMMQQLPGDILQRINTQCPAAGFRWTRELITTALVGSPDQKSQIWERFFNGAMSFKQLVTHYSLTQPDIASMGTLFDDSSSRLIHQLRLMQSFEPLRSDILGTPATWDRDIASDIGVRFLSSMKDEISSYAQQYGFSSEVAERALQADGLRRLPYVWALVMWVRSYLARHKGLKYPRTPDENDIRDLLHCVNTPYVDVLVTDRFAAEVTRSLGQQFKTRIVRSLEDLASE